MQPSLRLALPYVARTTLPTTGASTATSNNPPIFISDGASASITPSKSTRVCSVCTKNAQRYTCSRCRISYCSSDCYRTHSTTCTESFYRDQVVSALKSAPAVQADARKSMAGVLLRTREARDATAVAGTDTSDLADQMDNLSLESLPPERRTDFMRALVDGRLSALEEVWTPWWEPKRLIAEMPVAAGRDESIEPTVDDTVDEDDQDLDDEHADFVDPIYSRAPRLSPPSGGLSFPIDRDLSIEQLSQVPLPVDLPSLSTLLSKPPSPCVAFSVIDALFSYVFVARLRNGEWLEDLQSALQVPLCSNGMFAMRMDDVHKFEFRCLFVCFQMVLGLSSVLKTNVIHMSVPEALEKVIASSLLPPLCAAPEFALTSARDVAQVLFFKVTSPDDDSMPVIALTSCISPLF